MAASIALRLAGAMATRAPAALDMVPVLGPLAAAGLVLLMIGAAITHARRSESRAIATTLVLLVIAGVVAWGRFGRYSFT